MNYQPETDTKIEVVAAFKDAASFEAAIGDLLSRGFDHAELSLLATDGAITGMLGHLYRRIEQDLRIEQDEQAAEDPPAAPKAYVTRSSSGVLRGALSAPLHRAGASARDHIVASGGALGTISAAAARADGSGIALGRLLAEAGAESLDTALDRGHVLLWVRCFSDRQARHAVEILARHTNGGAYRLVLPAHRLPAA